jgi:uncharacterized SAM-binding protein YcdF (DUF218 family)
VHLLTERERAIVLISNDRLKRSDVAVLLEGDGWVRVEEAVSLYRSGWVGKIVCSGGLSQPERGNYPQEMVVPALIRQGIPQDSIVVEGASQHTWDQAIAVLRLAAAHGWRRILLVASHYHQFRAYLTFLKAAAKLESAVEIVNAPARSPEWFAETAWGVRYDLLQVEFDKIEKYRGSGHVATFGEAIEYQRWKDART